MTPNHDTKAGGIKLGVVGGDLRQLVMARSLAEKGYEVALYGLDTYAGEYGGVTRCCELASAVRGCRAVILPLPATRDGERIHCPLTKNEVPIDGLFRLVGADRLVLGGRISEGFRRRAAQAGVRVIDYYEREELQIANAVPTAEGALAIAMSEVPYTIRGARCLVIGYGRIGKTLARLLAAVGASVTVTARCLADLAWIRSEGFEAERTENLAATAPGFDLIFNTVPAPVLSRDVLSLIPSRTLIIDLSSEPGGVDREYAAESGCRTVFAMSLPGKTAPVTAGHIIEESILNILEAEGVTEK